MRKLGRGHPTRSSGGFSRAVGTNQRADLGRDRRLPAASAALPSPENAKALAMPGDDCVRLHNHRCRWIVGAPAVDGGSRGPRDTRHATARCLGASPEGKSGRLSSSTEPTGHRRQVQQPQCVRRFQYAQARIRTPARTPAYRFNPLRGSRSVRLEHHRSSFGFGEGQGEFARGYWEAACSASMNPSGLSKGNPKTRGFSPMDAAATIEKT